MKYHKGDRPFACDQCPNRTFVSKGDLGRHMKMHERRKNKSSSNEPQIQEIFVDEDINVVKDELKEEPLSEPDSEHDYSSNVESAYLNFEPHIEFGEDSTDSLETPKIKVETTRTIDESKGNDKVNCNIEEATAVPCVEQKPHVEKSSKSKLSNRTPIKKKSKSSAEQAAKLRKVDPEKAPKTPVAKAAAKDDQDQKEDVKRFICDICTKCFRLKHHLGIHLRTHTDQKASIRSTYCPVAKCTMSFYPPVIPFFFTL